MPQLSIILVNYNVKHFLEQALLSVQRAVKNIEAEVFVVDNNSVDGSVGMLKERFPWVRLMANKENVGFSRANNQAIRESKGKYVLLLNPDTVVEEDTFEKVIAFMDSHPDCGGLGVKMVNGKGEFLPESKRALPTPWVAFYKVFGLSKLFPRSRKFGKYHLTYLDKEQNHQIEVLSGACMFLRSTVLDKIGLLDEDYFMYGEDIDLSYRITKAGFQNYYFADTQIIHYKGESTRKGSLNYVLVFYNAMLIFARKHFSHGRRRLFMLLIQLAIYFRALLAIGRRITSRGFFPLLEWISIYGLGVGMRYGYETLVANAPAPVLDHVYLYVAAPIYASVFVLLLMAFGSYRRPYRIRPLVLAVFFGFIAIATVNFVFKDLNFSRGTVALISIGTLLLTTLTRAGAAFIRGGSLLMEQIPQKRYIIIGKPKETQRVLRLLHEDIYYPHELVGVVRPEDNDAVNDTGQQPPVLGDTGQLDEITRYYAIEEVIFCNKSLSTHEIIRHMTRMASKGIHFKIVPNNADYLIGPNEILSSVAAQPLRVRLENPEIRLRKKVFDMAVSLVLVAAYPLTFWLYRHKREALTNLFRVLAGQYHLVGYIDGSQPELPRIKTGLLNIGTLLRQRQRSRSLSLLETTKLDYHYARNYSLYMDWEILVRGLRQLGEKPLKKAA